MNTANLPRASVSILKVIDQAIWRTSLSRLCAALYCFRPGTIQVVQPSARLDFTENKREKEIGVTECWECARILGGQRGALPDGVLPDVELFDFKIQRRPRNSEFDSRAIWSSNCSVAFRKSRLDKFLFIAVEALCEKT